MTDRAVASVHSGLYFPLFDELADPTVVARLAAEAEAAGWHGVFVWDQVRWHEPILNVGDPQITLAAVAMSTERILLGPMVTPLARRRPVKVARETAALDLLSGGRLRLGVGLGSDRFAAEYSMTGEEVDDRTRARMLDEALDVVQAAWSGEPVHHDGEHYTVRGMRFLPRPVQRPGIPIWVAGSAGNRRPLRRAVRYDGYFPMNLDHADQLAEMVDDLATLHRAAGKGPAGAYDIVVHLEPGVDPMPYVAAGATWWLIGFADEEATIDHVRGAIRNGPLKALDNGD